MFFSFSGRNNFFGIALYDILTIYILYIMIFAVVTGREKQKEPKK